MALRFEGGECFRSFMSPSLLCFKVVCDAEKYCLAHHISLSTIRPLKRFHFPLNVYMSIIDSKHIRVVTID